MIHMLKMLQMSVSETIIILLFYYLYSTYNEPSKALNHATGVELKHSPYFKDHGYAEQIFQFFLEWHSKEM
jgi:hypothetical protein